MKTTGKLLTIAIMSSLAAAQAQAETSLAFAMTENWAAQLGVEHDTKHTRLGYQYTRETTADSYYTAAGHTAYALLGYGPVKVGGATTHTDWGTDTGAMADVRLYNDGQVYAGTQYIDTEAGGVASIKIGWIF